MRKYLISLILSLPVWLFANNNYLVNNYSTENGLPHNTVFRSLKDSDGFMWFGTWYGLSCFDSYKFRSFSNRDDFNADIPPHKVQNIVESNDHNLWVKTIDHKLFLFDKHTEQYFDAFNEIKKKYNVSPKIIKIEPDRNGDLILLTKNKDLLRAKSLGGGKMEVELIYNSQSKTEIRQTSNILSEDKRFLCWIGLDFKVMKFEKGVALHSKPADYILRKIASQEGNQFSCAARFKETCWLGTETGSFFSINSINGDIQKYNVSGGSICNIIQLNSDLLYISVAGVGVFEYRPSSRSYRKIITIRPTERITDTFTDCYDKLWVVVNKTAIVYFDPFNAFSKRLELPVGNVNKSIQWQDGKEAGIIFLSTAGEPLWFNRENLQLQTLSSLPDLNQKGEHVVFFDLLLDKDNILWLSSTNNGIFRISFPKRQFSIIQIPQNSIVPSAVKTLYQARNGDIWVANRNTEVYQLSAEGVIKNAFTAKTFSIGNVYHIMEDSRGNIWFSTKGNGLVRAVFDNKSRWGYQFTRYTTDASNPFAISGNDVYYTYEDSKNRMWVALFGGGLNLIQQSGSAIRFISKNNSFKNYPRYGLYMEVRNIAEDKNGRIWVGTSDGLMSFKSDFKNPESIEFETYRSDNALSNISDNDIYVLYKDDAANIWISVFGGGLNKLIQYDERKKKPVFKEFSSKEGLKSDVILSIVQDDNQCLWLATENGLSRFDMKSESFRNFDRYDGFLDVQMEEESAIRLSNGNLWFGTRSGILAFTPQKIESYNADYKTFIVDFKVSNRDLRSFKDNPILKTSIRYAESITLKHDQSTFVAEFASLNYYNQNRVSYKYILEGFDNEWHYNGKNRIASYPNIPHGKYKFRVQAIDEANMKLKSEKVLEIIILPPWWLSWWAKAFYVLFVLFLIYLAIRGVLFYMRIRNEMYVEQRVSELKIRFFTNISHELRTPLTLIMGPIQELRQKQNLTEKGLQYVSMIEKNAQQMLQLVNQILDFRKIQNGKMMLHVSKVDIHALLEMLHKEFTVLSEENDIRFVLRAPLHDILVWVDKEKIETVIRNLLSNAFKFTKQGGKIELSAALNSAGDKCVITVTDTGIGIPANKLTEIFERFFQGENSKNVQSPGTGIGLALSKEIVNMHHGEIKAESKPGEGTVFEVELLLNKEHFNPAEVSFYVSDAPVEITPGAVIESQEVHENQPVDAHNLLPTLLIVEDNRDLCTLLRMQLDDRYRVFTASNGVEGLKKVKLHNPDIVVTDQMMPEMTGTEMMLAMRSDFNISHIPVIILTAKTDHESKLNAINLGANAYITKPFDKEYLIARIEQLLVDRRIFREKVWKQEHATAEPAKNEIYENYLQQKDVEFLDKIHKIIEENIDNTEFNIDSIADTVGISRSAFFKKLKSLTGLAPVDTIKEFRLNKSLELLKNTDLTISEVAYAVGFKEVGYYGKCFRKKYNQSPSEYITQNRKLN